MNNPVYLRYLLSRLRWLGYFLAALFVIGAVFSSGFLVLLSLVVGLGVFVASAVFYEQLKELEKDIEHRKLY